MRTSRTLCLWRFCWSKCVTRRGRCVGISALLVWTFLWFLFVSFKSRSWGAIPVFFALGNAWQCLILCRMWAVPWSRSLQGKSRFLWTRTAAAAAVDSTQSPSPYPPCWSPAASLNPATLTRSSRTRCSSGCRGRGVRARRWTGWPTARATTTEVSGPEGPERSAGVGGVTDELAGALTGGVISFRLWFRFCRGSCEQEAEELLSAGGGRDHVCGPDDRLW